MKSAQGLDKRKNKQYNINRPLENSERGAVKKANGNNTKVSRKRKRRTEKYGENEQRNEARIEVITEGLILAQSERWRRVLGMQVERQHDCSNTVDGEWRTGE